MRDALVGFFFLPEPVAFRRVYGLEAYSWTSRESNHHQQSVSAVKNDALPTEPRGHLRDVLVGYLSPLPHSGRFSSELPLALRPSNKHYWKCARITPENMMIGKALLSGHLSSCVTVRLTLFCVSPLSLRPGVAGVCFEVPSSESLCFDGLCHVISEILAGGFPHGTLLLHSLAGMAWWSGCFLICCFAIPF